MKCINEILSIFLLKFSVQEGALEELKQDTEGMKHIIWSQNQVVQQLEKLVEQSSIHVHT